MLGTKAQPPSAFPISLVPVGRRARAAAVRARRRLPARRRWRRRAAPPSPTSAWPRARRAGSRGAATSPATGSASRSPTCRPGEYTFAIFCDVCIGGRRGALITNPGSRRWLLRVREPLASASKGSFAGYPKRTIECEDATYGIGSVPPGAVAAGPFHMPGPRRNRVALEPREPPLREQAAGRDHRRQAGHGQRAEATRSPGRDLLRPLRALDPDHLRPLRGPLRRPSSREGWCSNGASRSPSWSRSKAGRGRGCCGSASCPRTGRQKER